MNKSKPSSSSIGANNNNNNTSSVKNTNSNSQKPPKSPAALDKLKSTSSNFTNNNVNNNVSRKASTASNGGRPSSASSQKGNSSVGGGNGTVGNKQQGGNNTNNNNSKGSGGGGSPKQTHQGNPITPNQKSTTSTTNRSTTVSSVNVNKSLTSNYVGNGNNASARPKSTGPVTGVGSNNVAATISTLPNNNSNSNNKNNSSGSNNNKSVANSSTFLDNKPTTTTIIIPTLTKPKGFPTPVSQTRYPSSRSQTSVQRSKNFRSYVEKAVQEHKVFSCCGVYPAIRNALKKRGWVEKPGNLALTRSANTTTLLNDKVEDESDVAWMTRTLKDHIPDFVWVIRRDNIDWKNVSRDQLINRFPRAWFTTKVGLAACLQHMHWFSEAGISDTFFPRCYRLCLEEERQAFQDDFRLTACMSYLRYFVDTFEKKGHTALADVHSKITPLSVDFASRQLGNYIRMRRHEDIDWLLPPNFMTQHWDAFIHQYYAVVHDKKRLRFDNAESVRIKYETAKKMLHKVAAFWPQIQLDGVYNMWICKPGARSRGKGIVIMNNLEKIMDLMTQSNFRECNWVVQKYIERPMLIYKTKYDIRQWFIITDWTPLTVWFYKESYARFCTKPFVLENFHESIHLCNNAIQCRYQNAEQRDSNLPEENMWSSDTFQAYLKTLGKLDAWPQIYSKMKQAIVGVLLASQENVESKKGCFELYGADFMLTEDFQPWLIEINSCPCMAASTSVTARMCTQCLEDTIKVVIDRRNNRNAETGMFEMIYRQNAGSVVVQQFSGHDLTIIGKKLTRDIDWPMTMPKSMSSVPSKHHNHQQNKSQASILQQPQSSPSNQNNNNNSNKNGPVTNNNNSNSASTANDTTTISTNNLSPPSNKQTLSQLLQKLRVRNQEMFHGTVSQTPNPDVVAHSSPTKDENSNAIKESKSTSVASTRISGGANTVTERSRSSRNPHNSSLVNMMLYNKHAGHPVPLQHFSGHDLAIIGKKLVTRDIDWLPLDSYPAKFNRSQSIIPSSNSSLANYNRNIIFDGDASASNRSLSDLSPAADNNKSNNKPAPTLSQLLQKLRARNQEVFKGALALI